MPKPWSALRAVPVARRPAQRLLREADEPADGHGHARHDSAAATGGGTRARPGGRQCWQPRLAEEDFELLGVALMMALEPKVFMFDEPTAGMSVDEVPVVLDLIARLKQDTSKIILLVEHKMDVVRSLADGAVRPAVEREGFVSGSAGWGAVVARGRGGEVPWGGSRGGAVRPGLERLGGGGSDGDGAGLSFRPPDVERDMGEL